MAPKINIKKLISKFILKKKCIIVIINEIVTKPKNTSEKISTYFT